MKLFKIYSISYYDVDGVRTRVSSGSTKKSIYHADVFPDGSIFATFSDGSTDTFPVEDHFYPTLSVEVKAISDLAYMLHERGVSSDDFDGIYDELPQGSDECVERIAGEIFIAERYEPMELVNRTGCFKED